MRQLAYIQFAAISVPVYAYLFNNSLYSSQSLCGRESKPNESGECGGRVVSVVGEWRVWCGSGECGGGVVSVVGEW